MKYNLIAFIISLITCTIIFEINEKSNEEVYKKEYVVKSFFNKHENEAKPNVEIILPEHNENYTWGSQVRYSIKVEDETDGESRYNEINPGEVFLEIQFITNSEELIDQKKESNKINNKGLTIIGRSSCFGCHADENSMVGPSFSEIADRYKEENDTNSKNSISNNIIDGTIGFWGDNEMPSYPDFSEEEVMAIAEYILIQGAKKNGWVYPGLEGVFRVIDEPDNNSSGFYLLTASYTSSTLQRGQDSIILTISN